MEKPTYNTIQKETIKDRYFHSRLVELIKTIRERELENSTPVFEVGKATSLFAYNQIKRNLTDLAGWDNALDCLLPNIKDNPEYNFKPLLN